MSRSAQDLHYAGKRQDSLFCTGAKFRPALNMLFGREEMYAASRKRPIRSPLLQRNIDIAAYAGSGLALDFSVANNGLHQFTAIETWKIDLN